MASARVDSATLDGMSKKELVVLIQGVAPLELLQANSVCPFSVHCKMNALTQ